MNYLLDTNICIYIINRHPSSVLERISSKQADEIAVSTITIAELEYGTERSHYPDQNRIALLQFLTPFTILAFDQRAASYYGRIRKSLETKGQPIGPMDLLLACQALSHDLVLVTNNMREFKRVEGLRIENWLK